MNEILNKHEALKIIDEFAILLSNCKGCEEITIFCVGSLAEDDFRANSSDIDVVVVTKNDTNLNSVKKFSNEIINIIKKKHQTNIEFDAYVKPEKEVFPPYEFGQNQTIEAMRLKKQAKLVKGKFNIDNIPVPTKDDFLADAIMRDKKMQKDIGERFIDEISPKETINLILEYFRLNLMLSYEQIEFNKTKLIEEYYKKGQINVDTYNVLKKMRKGEEVSDEELKNIKKLVKQKRNEILYTEKDKHILENNELVH